MKVGFLKHARLAFFRSPSMTQKIVEGLIVGFFFLYGASGLLFMGMFAPKIIRELAPHENPTAVVAGAFCVYLIFDIIIRYFFQKFPSALVKPYLLLPVSRKKIVRYVLLRSLLSPLNLILPVFLIPFFFVEVLPNESGVVALGIWLLGLSSLLTANFVAYAITVFSGSKKSPAFFVIVFLLLLIYLEYRGVTHFLPYVFHVGKSLVSTTWLWAVVVAMPVAIIVWLYKKFVSQIAYQTVSKQSTSKAYLPVKGIFSNFGKHGILMDLEVRLILRSKRARTLALSSIIFLFFPLYVIPMSGSDMDMSTAGSIPVLFFALLAFFATGGFALNYGQLMLSWNSSHFDLLMSRGFKMKDIFLAKYYLLALSCGVFFLVTLPYVFLWPKYFLASVAMALWNASFSIYGYMLLSSINSKRIDLNAGGMFNHEGFGFMHYLIMVPLMAVPFGFYGLFVLIAGDTGGTFVFSAIGLMGILFHKKIIQGCVLIFEKNRYKISNAFRTR